MWVIVFYFQVLLCDNVNIIIHHDNIIISSYNIIISLLLKLLVVVDKDIG